MGVAFQLYWRSTFCLLLSFGLRLLAFFQLYWRSTIKYSFTHRDVTEQAFNSIEDQQCIKKIVKRVLSRTFNSIEDQQEKNSDKKFLVRAFNSIEDQPRTISFNAYSVLSNFQLYWRSTWSMVKSMVYTIKYLSTLLKINAEIFPAWKSARLVLSTLLKINAEMCQYHG